MQPFHNSRAEWPILIAVLAIGCAVVALYAQGCTLHTSVIGHRIDEPPVVVDDDGGMR